MRCFTLLSVILIPIVLSQDLVDFGDNDQTNVDVEESDVNLKTGEPVDGDDVNTRFFNIDLNTFAGQVAASAVGTVVGNAGVNLAGNLLSNCNNRGKRSVLMHKLEKRQAIEGNERSGNTEDDPEVATRLICPQDLLNPGGSNNGRYCDRCYCSDWDCRRDCRKCGNSGLTGWSSNSGNNNGWSSSSGNNNWGQSSSNHVNCNSCYCSSSSCRNTCRKCASSSNSGHYNNNNSGSGHYHTSVSTSTTYVNCNTCYCSNNSCKLSCSRCRNNNSGYNSGGSYNNGWRNSNSVNGRTGENSGDSEVVASQDNNKQETNNGDESVVFA